MKYQILQADRVHDLSDSVNRAMRNGWLPLGQPFVLPSAAGTAVCQAVTWDADQVAPAAMVEEGAR